MYNLAIILAKFRLGPNIYLKAKFRPANFCKLKVLSLPNEKIYKSKNTLSNDDYKCLKNCLTNENFTAYI